MIGRFGSVKFEVGPEVLRTFKDFKKKKRSRFQVHDIIGASQKLQYAGSELLEVSFNMRFNKGTCEDIEAELERVENMVSSSAYRLIIGGVNYGLFVLEEVSESYDFFDSKGTLLGAGAELRLREYA